MENFNLQLILASNSPRRKQLLEEAGFRVKVMANQVNEDYPASLPASEVARYLAEKKALQYKDMPPGSVLITADTIVKVGDEILGKPAGFEEGFTLLQMLSGRSHEVITGVCLRSAEKTISFDETTQVYFASLTDEEIEYYLKNYFPYDKAGAYGIQEWIGLMAVERIEGSYFNVVGLPVHKVYSTLKKEFT